MTNYGFHAAMAEAGIEVATTPVGDRYVLEALRERGWSLGGEQSGHIIDMGFDAVGRRDRRGAADARGARRARPARARRDGEAAAALVNVRVARPRGARGGPDVQAAVEREARGARGSRACARAPSGTEPLVRVMVEAPTRGGGRARYAQRLVAAVQARVAGRRTANWTGGRQGALSSLSSVNGRKNVRRRTAVRSGFKEGRPCAESSATSAIARSRSCSWRGWRSSSTAGTTAPASPC